MDSIPIRGEKLMNFTSTQEVSSLLKFPFEETAKAANDNSIKNGFLFPKNRVEKKKRFCINFVNNANFRVPDYKFIYISSATQKMMKNIGAPAIGQPLKIKVLNPDLTSVAQIDSVLASAPNTLPGLNWEWSMEHSGYLLGTENKEYNEALQENNVIKDNYVILVAMNEDYTVRYAAIVNMGKLCYWWVNQAGNSGLKSHIFGNREWRKLFEEKRFDIIQPLYNEMELLLDVHNW